jgi:hypothetical protein
MLAVVGLVVGILGPQWKAAGEAESRSRKTH